LLPLAAQEQKQHFTINVGTPEGQTLQAIGQNPTTVRSWRWRWISGQVSEA